MFSFVRPLLVATLAFVLLGSALSLSAAEPKSYPLLCKGGGVVTLNFPPVQETSPGFNGTVVGLSFNKSSGPATSGLQPGQCAWMDRSLNAKEPGTLMARFPGAYVYISAVSTQAKPGEFYPVYRYSGAQAQKSNLQKFVTAISRGEEFQVYAYNDGRDLIVTKFGP